MLWPEFCIAKAEECELNAAEAQGPALAREWLWMASEWRLTAALAPEALSAAKARRSEPRHPGHGTPG